MLAEAKNTHQPDEPEISIEDLTKIGDSEAAMIAPLANPRFSSNMMARSEGVNQTFTIFGRMMRQAYFRFT